MRLSNKKKFEMPDLKKFKTEEQAQLQVQEQELEQPETITQPEGQPETITPEAAPEVQEVQLSDGQTEAIPEADPIQFSDARLHGLQQMTTTINSRYYTQEEFEHVFKDFFDFLKDPKAADDVFCTIEEKGRNLAADRVFEMAQRYKWLNWLIDKQTAVLHDFMLISIWAAVETNAIILNWTGVSIFEKVQIWVKLKIKTKAEQAAKEGKRSVWGFLGRRAAEKQQKQES